MSSATQNHTKNFSDNIAVVQCGKLSHMTWSFQVIICVLHCIRKNGLSQRDCDACLETHLAIRILHPAVTQKIDISDSRAVIAYVEHQHTTCSFRVTSLSTHKMLYLNVGAFCVWTHNSPIVSRIQALTKKIDTCIFNSRSGTSEAFKYWGVKCGCGKRWSELST